MRKKLALWVGKSAKLLSRMRGGGGSALPGLVTEKLYPDFLSEVFKDIPVIVVSGTNGKTTTTKIIVELLTDYGLRVFTNPTGSNFTRGIVSAVLDSMRGGKFDFDMAVLELDEAHAVHFVKKIKPTYSLLLNVLRDQMDRFGEIDSTAGFLKAVAESTSGIVVLNRDDPLLNGIKVKNKMYFGYSSKIAPFFPNDDEIYGLKDSAVRPKADILLEKLSGSEAIFNIGSARLRLPGAHNALNATGALALVRAVVGERFDARKSLLRLEKVEPAFGRGEKLIVNGKVLEMILVKNPSGFRVVLASQNNTKAATMIAINDKYADGRDMSWLWDVDFSVLSRVNIVSGIRAYDMALRLQYDEVPTELVETDLKKALGEFLSRNQDARYLQIYCTYTAMLRLRELLASVTKVEKVL